jgi:radical SAM protein with 4Fe4S-binding SPASM domain
MCNIWQSDSQNDLSLVEIQSIISSPLLSDVRWVTITGGEPFLRNDLVHVIKSFVSNQKKIQEILIATNALLTDHIVGETKKVLKILPDDIRLRIGISFDGLAEKHDKVRNIKGIHNCAIATVRALQEIPDNRLYLQGHVAVGPHNIDELEEMPDYYKNIIDKLNWFPIIISDNYFKNTEKKDSLLLAASDRERLKIFLERIVGQEPPSPSTYYYSRLTDFLKTGYRNFPCTGGYRFMQIDSRGNVHPCPFVPTSYSFGNVQELPLSEIWLSRKANRLRKSLSNSGICEKCSSHCDVFTVVREEFFDFFRFMGSHPQILLGTLKRYFEHSPNES